MDNFLFGQLLYAFGWLSFGFLHSVLASHPSKSVLRPLLGRAYRLAYNIFAVLHVGLVAVVGEIYLNHQPFQFPEALTYGRWVVFALGIVMMWRAAKTYDLSRLSGTYQLQNPDGPEDEGLHLDGFHRFIRHPLYSAGFLILWGRVGDQATLTTAIWASLYLIIGAWYEEKRLVRLYGDAYRNYQKKVGMFIPSIIAWKST